MGSPGDWSKLPLGILFAGVLGCMTMDTNAGRNAAKEDPLQAEIFRQYTLLARPGWWKPDPEVIYKEIPQGTPIAEARAVMTRHGFFCTPGLGDEKGTYLHCEAFRRTGRVTRDRLSVKIYQKDGQVADIDVTAFYDVP
jgi:hypothetical protein